MLKALADLLLLVSPGGSLFAQQRRSLLRHAPPGVMKLRGGADVVPEALPPHVQQWMTEQREQPPPPQDYAQAQPHDTWQQHHHQQQQPAPAYPPQHAAPGAVLSSSFGVPPGSGPGEAYAYQQQGAPPSPGMYYSYPGYYSADVCPHCGRPYEQHSLVDSVGKSLKDLGGGIVKTLGLDEESKAAERRRREARAAAAERERIAAERARHMPPPLPSWAAYEQQQQAAANGGWHAPQPWPQGPPPSGWARRRRRPAGRATRRRRRQCRRRRSRPSERVNIIKIPLRASTPSQISSATARRRARGPPAPGARAAARPGLRPPRASCWSPCCSRRTE